MSPERYVLVCLAFDSVLFYFLMRMFFGGFRGFLQASNFSGRSDWTSLLRGELFKDWKETLKLNLFVAICSLTIIAQLLYLRGS